MRVRACARVWIAFTGNKVGRRARITVAVSRRGTRAADNCKSQLVLSYGICRYHQHRYGEQCATVHATSQDITGRVRWKPDGVVNV